MTQLDDLRAATTRLAHLESQGSHGTGHRYHHAPDDCRYCAEWALAVVDVAILGSAMFYPLQPVRDRLVEGIQAKPSRLARRAVGPDQIEALAWAIHRGPRRQNVNVLCPVKAGGAYCQWVAGHPGSCNLGRLHRQGAEYMLRRDRT